MENNNGEEGNENDVEETLGDYEKVIVTEDYDQNDIELVKDDNQENAELLPIEYKISREINDLDSASVMR